LKYPHFLNPSFVSLKKKNSFFVDNYLYLNLFDQLFFRIKEKKREEYFAEGNQKKSNLGF